MAAGFSPFLVKFTLLTFAFNPLSKYSLLVKPINNTLESVANITNEKHILLSRVGLNLMVLLFASLFPAFHKVMGFIGAALSFTIVTITPTACYLKLNPHGHVLKKVVCWLILVFGLLFMVFSTISLIISSH